MSLDKLERRLVLAERVLKEARSRRSDLEACLADAQRRVAAEEQRADRARELLVSLEHRSEAQREQLEHWQRKAEEAQAAAATTVEALAAAAAADRDARVRLNAVAVGLINRLTAALPWSPLSEESAGPPPAMSAEEFRAAASGAGAAAGESLEEIQRLQGLVKSATAMVEGGSGVAGTIVAAAFDQ